jgi:Tfp pilus assembly protein PilV
MRILVLTISLMALLAVPAVTLASEPSAANQATAQQRCRDQLKAMEVKDFRALYGTNHNKRNAFGKCVSKLAQQEAANQQNAAQRCRTERDADQVAFANKYGTNHNKSNAFGKCVSQKAKAKSQAEQQTTLNAAKDCKAERADDPAAFQSKYGKNHNKQNAFGKCVSMKAKQK